MRATILRVDFPDGSSHTVTIQQEYEPEYGDAVILIGTQPIDVHIEAITKESETDDCTTWRLSVREGFKGGGESVLFDKWSIT